MGTDARGITAITSRDNPKLKQVRALKQRKARDASGLFLVEGIRHVGECAAADLEARNASKTPWLEYICFSPDLLTSDYARELIRDRAARGLPCYSLPAELFALLADKENPQGILAVARQHRCTLDGLNPRNFPWGAALVDPQDPGNIGAILRTIDAVGASGLLLLGNSADPYHPSAVRASMGAIFWYPTACASFSEFVSWVKGTGYTVIGTSAHGSQDYRATGAYAKPLILLMGSEREGMTDDQKAACDLLVRMPMQGRVSSLNLAVATGIMLYTLLEKLS
jgi:RNA methyltransferase, TrmH family